MIRRFLHLYWRLVRGMTLGVRAVVLREGPGGREVLLVRHGYVAGWHLPGGGVEPDETFRQALDKELREEGNVTLTAPARLFAIYQNRQASTRDHVALYVVQAFDYGGAPAPTFEIKESKFFALDALPADTTPATRRRLAEVLEGVAPAEQW
jgi:ADP-ribose pyrophosphatase YjhB (NUDIX family)